MATFVMLGNVPERVSRGLEDARREWFAVLRQYDAVGAATRTQFMREFSKVRRVREVDDAVRRGAVTIATTNDRKTEAFGEGQDPAILRPRTVAVQFERMNTIAVKPKEREERGVVPERANVGEIPEGMIEHDECLPALPEIGRAHV